MQNGRTSILAARGGGGCGCGAVGQPSVRRARCWVLLGAGCWLLSAVCWLAFFRVPLCRFSPLASHTPSPPQPLLVHSVLVHQPTNLALSHRLRCIAASLHRCTPDPSPSPPPLHTPPLPSLPIPSHPLMIQHGHRPHGEWLSPPCSLLLLLLLAAVAYTEVPFPTRYSLLGRHTAATPQGREAMERLAPNTKGPSAIGHGPRPHGAGQTRRAQAPVS
ncbi:hypothetical protein N431DRAFT_60530 [Stipitochalara longipes BDJ]|nr:hypothetical protein N431DRAFT_60530 [Stipitochalara longipes BDJ]